MRKAYRNLLSGYIINIQIIISHKPLTEKKVVLTFVIISVIIGNVYLLGNIRYNHKEHMS